MCASFFTHFVFLLSRNICLQKFFKIGVLENFANFTEKHFTKLACLQACNFIKKRLWHKCFQEIFKNTFFNGTLSVYHGRAAFVVVIFSRLLSSRLLYEFFRNVRMLLTYIFPIDPFSTC